MVLFVFTGFLGSGKTTLLLTVAKALSEQLGRKVAIVENDIGQVGIDAHYLKQKGLEVREIYSGCICCTLQSDLISTLQRLEQEHHPDVVIVEPSGLAGPHQLVGIIRDYGGKLQQSRLVVLIDAERLQDIPMSALPMIHDGIKVADLVLINKIDRVTESQLAGLVNRIGKVKPDAKVIPISALHCTNVNRFLREIMCREDVDGLIGTQESEAAHSHTSGWYRRAVVHAKEIELSFNMSVTGDIIAEEISHMVYDLAGKMKGAGCSLIGHLKASVKTDKRGFLLVSTTTFDQQPHEKGELPSNVLKAKITVNAIVYDVEERVAKNLVEENLNIFSYRVQQRAEKKVLIHSSRM